MYRTKLPMVLVFNKTDVLSHDFALNWMRDPEAFDAALQAEKSYMSSLTRSTALALEEFYRNIPAAGISAVTGSGMNEFFSAVKAGAKEYDTVYRAFLAERLAAKQQKSQVDEQKKIAQAMREAKSSKGICLP